MKIINEIRLVISLFLIAIALKIAPIKHPHGLEMVKAIQRLANNLSELNG